MLRRSRFGLLAFAMNLTSSTTKGMRPADRNSFLNTSRLVGTFLLWMLLLAVVTRSLIPVGYMPDFSGQGRGIFPLVACDGFSHEAASGHHHHHHHEDGQGNKPVLHELCPFASGAIASFSPALPVLAPQAVYIPAEITPFYVPPSGRQAVFANVSPRSPPFLS
ncbi:MAG TPA: DUF2946 family protein [Rickettsiales bacterium]|nr:DUF2946 family protein [Rickettsiales bacterium]